MARGFMGSFSEILMTLFGKDPHEVASSTLTS